MVIRNVLDLMKKSLQRLLVAIEGVGHRVSAEALQENAGCRRGVPVCARSPVVVARASAQVILCI